MLIAKKLNKTELKTLAALEARALANGQVGEKLEGAVECVQSILEQRGARYGDFADCARLSQQLQDTLRNHGWMNSEGEFYRPWGHLTAVQKQALSVICDKEARIMNGDPNYCDNWIDIEGYSKLVRVSLQNQN